MFKFTSLPLYSHFIKCVSKVSVLAKLEINCGNSSQLIVVDYSKNIMNFLENWHKNTVESLFMYLDINASLIMIYDPKLFICGLE